MPVVYDFLCETEGCDKRGIRFESLLRNWEAPDPPCPGCGRTLTRQFPAPRLGWVAKPWLEYDLKNSHREAGLFNPEGFWVTRRKTTARSDGEPDQVLIQSRQQLREYCKAEGYINPEDLPPRVEVAKDNKTLLTKGNAGQWV